MKFLVVALFAVLGASLVNGECPKFITRSMWGARSANTAWLPENPPPYLVMHHASSAHCYNLEDCKKMVKSFQDWHMDGNGWADIGYNFLIGEDGNIYEGRGWGKQGAHAPGANSRSLGVCIIGDFNSGLPNDKALAAAKAFISCAVEKGYLKTQYTLVGHRQVSETDCPGTRLYQEIQKWPHFGSYN